MSGLIELTGVTKIYGSGDAEVRALDGVDLTIDEGELIAVMGQSGSGKSTCMNILGCLDAPTGGTYLFRKVDVGSLDKKQLALLRRYYIGFVFQGFNLLARTSAIENVELPLVYRRVHAAERQERAHRALEMVGLAGRESHKPNQLSGGQQQRVAIARALATDPSVLLADEPTGNLDSARKNEIMELLVRLNKDRGITVIIITHEPDMAAYCDRVVEFRDGRIVSDGEEGLAMIRATLLMALREIRRNLMRSGLTMLGVMIGVAAVVALVSIGRAASAQVTANISSLGNNMLTLSPGAERRSTGGTAATPFDPEDVDAIQQQLRGLIAVAPTSSRNTIMVFGSKNWRCSATGTTNAYLKVRNYRVTTGREFSEEDLRTSKAACLLGATTRKELYGTQDPIGSTLRVGKMPCEVIGTLAAKGEGGPGMDQDDVVLMPLSAFQRKISGNHDVSSIYLSVEEGRPTSVVKSQLEALMRERRRIAPGASDDFSVRDMQEIASAMQGATSALTALLGAIAAVSLVVGGIGIMNIMLVSVSERTREIGTRLAIGATGSEVLWQFLVEAVMLSTCGGVIGAFLGVAGSAAGTQALAMPFVFVPEIVMVAFVFSATIGVVFGYLPARKAAALNPIEALRHE